MRRAEAGEWTVTGMTIVVLLIGLMMASPILIVSCDRERILGHEEHDCIEAVCCESSTYSELHSECCAEVICVDPLEPCCSCDICAGFDCPDDEGVGP